MALQIDAVQQSCRMIARQMRDYTRALNLSFIVHRSGQRLESLSLAGQELLGHPAGEAAIRLMRDQKKSENSTFLGLAVWHENLFLGLATRQNMMALTTLNIDEYESLREIRGQAWHMAWHAIHLYNQRNDPARDNAFRNGVALPNYDEETLLSANLRADAFSAIMCNMSGDKDAIRRLAHSRCIDSLVRRAGYNPEEYPFPLAMEATQVAFSDIAGKLPSRNRQIHTALKLAENIALTYDEEVLKQWTDYCKPAQNMAWRGEEKEIILGAAVGISQDTYIRATGFLVCEITQIAPSSILNLENRYIPFSEDHYNQRLHESLIDRAFEKAVSSGLQQRNAIPFLDAANEQNEKLADGHMFGWCAAALQAAGKAFDMAMKSGSKTAMDDARRQFDATRHVTTWDHLKRLGESILEQYRQGYAVTFSDILDFCGEAPALAGVANSVAFTMRDPSYLKKLNISNDRKPGMMSQFTPATAPRMSAPSAGVHIALGEPGLGGSGSPFARQRIHPPDDDRRDQ